MNDSYEELLGRLLASERRVRLLVAGLFITIVTSTVVIALPVYKTQSGLENSVEDHRRDSEGHAQRSEDVHAEQTAYILCIARLSEVQGLEDVEALEACAKEAKDSFQDSQGLPGQPQTRSNDEVPKQPPAPRAPDPKTNPQQEQPQQKPGAVPRTLDGILNGVRGLF